MAVESRTAVVAAMAGNAALGVLKGVAAGVTGSAAMLAETFHSIADTGNQALLFLGMRLARRPPDRIHPFGHGRNVYFWAFVVSLMLFSVGGAFALWEAVRTFLHPHPHESFLWSYVVLAGGFVYEGVSLGVAASKVRQALEGRSLREYWRENRDPTLPTVVFEDVAALVSLVVAGGGLALVQATGAPVWDGVASAVIGVILISVAVVLAFENYSLLIGESAPRDVERTVCRLAVAAPGVERVLSLETMHLGPEELLVVLRVRYRPDLPAAQVVSSVARLHDEISRAVTSTRPHLVIVEPGTDEADRLAASTASAGDA